MSLAILGLGTAVPACAIAQDDAGVLAKTYGLTTEVQAQWLKTLYLRTRIRRRGSILLEDTGEAGVRQTFFPPATGGSDRGPTTRQRMARYVQEAATLAVQAAQQALTRSSLGARGVTHLVTISCTGFSAPGVDIALIKQLKLPATIGRTHVGFMGCHGALNGLRVASALAETSPDARVLLCAVELCSIHFHYGWDPEQAVANALFADGAAALVAAALAAAPKGAWRVAASGACLFPDSEEAMTWRIGDHGFEMTLSPAVPALIARHLRPWLASWLGAHGLTVRQVPSWAIHPGGPRILDTVASALALTPAQTAASSEVLASYGNMSSPTILFILDRLRRGEAPRPCVALGFGPGLAVEAALVV